MKNTDGEPMEGMEGWRSHTLQMACMGLYMRQWVKRSWMSIAKEKEQKIVWLIVLSLVRNKMRKKNHKELLRNVESKNTRLFLISQNCRDRNLETNENARGNRADGNVKASSCIHGKGIPLSWKQRLPSLGCFNFVSASFCFPFLRSPLPCFSLLLPLCILL